MKRVLLLILILFPMWAAAQSYLYKGRSTFSGNTLYTFDGRYIYKGRTTFSSSTLYTYDGAIPIAVLVMLL